MPDAKQIADLVERVPDLDKFAKIHGPTWDQMAAILDPILAGGRDSLVALIDLLKPVDNGDDWKVRYVIHAMAVYVTRPGKEGQRKMASDAVAAQLGGDRPHPIQKFLILELKWFGGPESTATLGKLVADEDMYAEATHALVSVGGDDVAAHFRAALPDAKDRRRTATIQALGTLRDAKSADALREALGDTSSDTRQIAAWALARIADPAAVSPVTAAADKAEGFERVKTDSAALLLAENLAAAGKKDDARKVYQHLIAKRTGVEEAYLRDAAERGLKSVG